MCAAPRSLWHTLRSLCSAGRHRTDFPWASGPTDVPWASGPPVLPSRRSPVQAPEASPEVPSEAVAATVCQSAPDRDTVLAAAARAATKAEATAEHLKMQMDKASDAEHWRHRAEALRARRQGADSVDMEQIELPDPNKDLEENESICIKKAEKSERTHARCAALMAEAVAEAESWRAAAAALPQAEASAETLQALHSRLHQAGFIKDVQAPVAPNPAVLLRRKYGKEIDCFLSPSGHEVAVGRSAGANERLSFELAWQDGFWFHADCGVAGSHVAILCRAVEVCCLEDVEFAAGIAAWHSKARGASMASVCYCYGGQLSRPNIPKLGLVHIRGPRGRLEVVPTPPP